METSNLSMGGSRGGVDRWKVRLHPTPLPLAGEGWGGGRPEEEEPPIFNCPGRKMLLHFRRQEPECLAGHG